MKARSRAFAIALMAACLGAGLLAPAANAAPAPAWAPIAASGPTNLPPTQSEIVRVSVDASEGTFALTVHKLGVHATGDIGAGGSLLTDIKVKAGTFAVGQPLFASFLQAGTTITKINKNPFFGTITSIEISKPAAAAAGDGDFFAPSASATTPPLPVDAEAQQVEKELNELSTVEGEGVEVSVSGGPGGKGAETPYFVSFEGSAANTNLPGLGLPLLEADGSELAGEGSLEARLTTALDGGPGTADVAIYPQNVGGAPSEGTTTIDVELPAGIVTNGTPGGWACAPAGAGESEVSCTRNQVAGPGFTLTPLILPVQVEEGASSGVVGVEVSGGGAVGVATYQMPLTVSALDAPPGFQSFTAAAYKEDGTIDTRAGAHPYSASAGILINTKRAKNGSVVPAGEFRDIVVDTPPGFFGNPTAAAACPEATEQKDCSHETVVATAQIPLESVGAPGELSTVSNIEAPFGYPAKFRFITGNNQIIVNVAASLRSDEDYGLETGSYNVPQIKAVMGSFFTIWGTPADEAHDEQRCANINLGFECGNPGGKKVAFLTNPVDCAEEALRAPVATLNVNTWQNPGLLFSEAVPLKPVVNCDELEFDAGFEFDSGTDDADSPASFTTELTTPSEGLIDPDKRINPTIRQTVIDLPEGVVLNASAADGLAACSETQIGLIGTNKPRPNEIRFTKNPNSCPDASKIGSGELRSSLIDEPLSAELFLAAQGDGNPFGSLFAIYLVIENPRNGIFIKLPGEVQVDEDSGRQKVVFKDLPPLPFDSLKLKLKGGDRSPLATPTTCGDYTTDATNTPWSAPESGPPLKSPSDFEIDDGPAGGCADSESGRPFVPGLAAGSDLLQAGAHTPLRFRVTRQDGHQELDTLRFDLPQGLAAKLKGVPYCPEALIAQAIDRDSGEDEQSSPSCPAASQVGRTLAGAGSGDRPFYAPGKLYLAGPYKNRPLSVVAITPAVAGPFDLGNVVVRNAIAVNPVTAQVTAISDEIPKIHEGIPLRVRDVRVILDRPGFALNPTGCEQKLIGAQLSGSHGAVSTLASRFQVGNCAALGFEPKTRVQLFGGVKRGSYQGVKAVVRPRPGDSNISGTVVRFPRSAFVAQEHLKNICTRVQFAANACPPSSIYGKAVAWSPLLDYPLEGNVHLRSSDNVLPDLVADLRGPAHQPIKVEVAIRNDSVKGALRNTVQAVPDAPVSYFRLQTFGGDKGLIVNSRNICGRNQARVAMNAHNGRRSVETVNVFNRRCKALKRKQRAKRRKAQRSAQRSKLRAQARRSR